MLVKDVQHERNRNKTFNSETAVVSNFQFYETPQIVRHCTLQCGRGFLSNPSHQSRGEVKSCGDDITFQTRIENKKIVDLAWFGDGCELCISSASVLSRIFIESKVSSLKNFTEIDLLDTLDVRVSDQRLGCILLPLTAFKHACGLTPLMFERN